VGEARSAIGGYGSREKHVLRGKQGVDLVLRRSRQFRGGLQRESPIVDMQQPDIRVRGVAHPDRRNDHDAVLAVVGDDARARRDLIDRTAQDKGVVA